MKIFNARRFVSVVGVLVFACAAVSPPAQARMPSDLKLRETPASKVSVLPQPNPHDQSDLCTNCHSAGVFPARKPILETDEFLNDDYPDHLCYDCHKGWVELHPNRIDPKKSRLKISVPANVLPLRFIAEGWYTVVCMTCHDIHFPHTGFKLLRGYSMNPTARPSRFTDRMAFCESCHGDQMKYLTPHKVRNLQAGCTLCHVRKPSGGRSQPLRANVNTLCTYCHPVFPEPHYLNFNPFPDMDENIIWKSGVPLRDGAYTCITCHLPHGSSAAPAYLREEFIDLTRISVRINPHEKGLFCQNCHTDPSLTRNSTRKSPGLVDKDVNALCSRCHGIDKNKFMHHYLGALTDRVKTAGNLPLQKGNITCITCHQPGCGPTTRDNPNFLRGNPASIRDLCAQCHDWTQRAVRNIHAEMLNNQGCDLCHGDRIPAPDQKNGSPGDPGLDQNFVCIQCHEIEPHPASHRHTGKPKKAEFITIDTKTFPLDTSQRVTCYTCHQICRKTPSPMFLRGGSSASATCQFCHPY